MFTTKSIVMCLAIVAISNVVHAEKEAVQTFGLLGSGLQSDAGLNGANVAGIPGGAGVGVGTGQYGRGMGVGTGIGNLGLRNGYDGAGVGGISTGGNTVDDSGIAGRGVDLNVDKAAGAGLSGTIGAIGDANGGFAASAGKTAGAGVNGILAQNKYIGINGVKGIGAGADGDAAVPVGDRVGIDTSSQGANGVNVHKTAAVTGTGDFGATTGLAGVARDNIGTDAAVSSDVTATKVGVDAPAGTAGNVAVDSNASKTYTASSTATKPAAPTVSENIDCQTNSTASSSPNQEKVTQYYVHVSRKRGIYEFILAEQTLSVSIKCVMLNFEYYCILTTQKL